MVIKNWGVDKRPTLVYITRVVKNDTLFDN